MHHGRAELSGLRDPCRDLASSASGAHQCCAARQRADADRGPVAACGRRTQRAIPVRSRWRAPTSRPSRCSSWPAARRRPPGAAPLPAARRASCCWAGAPRSRARSEPGVLRAGRSARLGPPRAPAAHRRPASTLEDLESKNGTLLAGPAPGGTGAPAGRRASRSSSASTPCCGGWSRPSSWRRSRRRPPAAGAGGHGFAGAGPDHPEAAPLGRRAARRSCCWARPGWARRSTPAPCTPPAAGRAPFVAVNCAALPARAGGERAVRLPPRRPLDRPGGQARAARAGRGREPCSSTRSARCPRRRRPSCCVSCRTASCCRWGRRSPGSSTCGCWPPPTGRSTPEQPGGLRADLLGRLGAAPVHLPPLRDRLEDLGALTAHILERASRRGRRPAGARGRRLPRAVRLPLAAQRARAGEGAGGRRRAHAGRPAHRACAICRPRWPPGITGTTSPSLPAAWHRPAAPPASGRKAARARPLAARSSPHCWSGTRATSPTCRAPSADNAQRSGAGSSASAWRWSSTGKNEPGQSVL